MNESRNKLIWTRCPKSVYVVNIVFKTTVACAVIACNDGAITAQKIKLSMKDFFSKYDQIRRKLRIWSHLLKKSLMENFIFSAVYKTNSCV